MLDGPSPEGATVGIVNKGPEPQPDAVAERPEGPPDAELGVAVDPNAPPVRDEATGTLAGPDLGAEVVEETPEESPVELFGQKIEVDYQVDQAGQEAAARELVGLITSGKFNLDIAASSIEAKLVGMSEEQENLFFQDHPGARAIMRLRSFRNIPVGKEFPTGNVHDLTTAGLSIEDQSRALVRIIGLRPVDADNFTFVVESRPGAYPAGDTRDLAVEKTKFYERILLDGTDNQQTSRRLIEVGRAAGKPTAHEIRSSVLSQVREGKTLDTKWGEFLSRHGGKIFVDEEMFVDLCKTGGITHDFLSQKADEIGRDIKVRNHTITNLTPGTTVQYLDGTQEIVTATNLAAVKSKLSAEVGQFEVDEKIFRDLSKLLEKGDQAYKDVFSQISEGKIPQAQLTELWEAIGTGDPDKVVDQLFMNETRRARTKEELEKLKKRKAAYGKALKYSGYAMAVLAIMAAMGMMSGGRER